jgi:hypothetical protein
MAGICPRQIQAVRPQGKAKKELAPFFIADELEKIPQTKLERARGLTDLGSFDYYKSGSTVVKDSSVLAQEAIGWFMLDKGFTLPNYATTSLHERPTDMEKVKSRIRSRT